MNPAVDSFTKELHWTDKITKDQMIMLINAPIRAIPTKRDESSYDHVAGRGKPWLGPKNNAARNTIMGQ
jgi:hypothetical protein